MKRSSPVALLGLCLIIGLSNPVFFTVGNLFDLLRSSIVMGIFAMGVLIVIVSGGIDVSFTAIAVFALYATTRILKECCPGCADLGWLSNRQHHRSRSRYDQRILHRPIQAADPDRHTGHA